MNNETKHDKFIRLAETRTNKIIDMIQLLGNCSNQSVYEYSDQEVNKIFFAIQKELETAKQRFQVSSSKRNDSKFKLK